MVLLTATAYLHADILIDFENLPLLPAQPDNFAAAGAEQTYNDPGVFTVSGGVVLGNPTFLPAFPANGSPPNLYGTTDLGDPSLQPTIQIAFPVAEDVTRASLTLFNGQNFAEDYTITTTVGGVPFPTPVSLQAASNGAGSFIDFSVTSFAGPITELDITTPNAAVNGWGFFVDDVGAKFTATTAVPEPSSLILLASGLLSAMFVRRKSRNR